MGKRTGATVMNNETKEKLSFIKTSLLIISAAIILFMVFGIFGPMGIMDGRGIRITRAKGEIRAIKTAVLMYYEDCEELPYNASKDMKFTQSNADEYDKLLEILTNEDGPDKDSIATSNKRGICYLDTPNDFSKKGYTDPWGNRYVIYLDLDKDKKIIIGDKEYSRTVIIYSTGPDGIDDNTKNDDISNLGK